MVPPRIDGDPEFQTDEVLVSEHTFKTKDEARLREYLRKAHATGTLTIHLVNGGTNKVSFTQKQAVEVSVGK